MHAFWNARTPVAAKAMADTVKFFENTLKRQRTP